MINDYLPVHYFYFVSFLLEIQPELLLLKNVIIKRVFCFDFQNIGSLFTYFIYCYDGIKYVFRKYLSSNT